ncbi:ABC transporter permease [Angustibacter sp. Root456]|uniref:ABC transporter permease n=1 Tax=Angustibacter sp. Root456 TaxID=1736539 RepID=UPI00138F9125|nr:FtsX-like permease family protein [Angustibacter sp. Root456]
MTLSGVRGHVVRFLLTTLSVMLGVAFVAGTFVLSDSLKATFDRISTGSTAGTDVVVRGVKVNSGVADTGDLRQPLQLSEAERLARIDGVRSAEPDLGGTAVLVGKDGTAVRNGGAPSFGFAFRPDDQALPLVAGHAPQGPDEVVVESTTLDKSGLKVGDRTRLVVAGTVQPVTIVGEEEFVGGSAGQTIVSVDPASAQKWFAPDGTVQSISLRADDGVSQQALRDRVAATLPKGQEAITGKTYADETKTSFAQGLGFINTFLLVFAFISLLVGVFIIFNTFSMLVAQRTRELALLRAVGAARTQVVLVVLGEAAVIGLAGGALGLLGGIGLAKGLQLLMGSFGLEFTGGLPVDAVTVVSSLAIGLLVTVASAVLPAWRAGRIAPVAAMRDDIALPERSLRLRGAVGLLLILVGVAVMAYGVGALDGSDAAKVLGLGAFLTFIGMIVAAPLISRPVLHLLGAPGAALSRTVGKLARDNTLRNPRRTSTTAISLMIGLALVSAFAVIAATTNASIDKLVDDQVTADFVLSGGNAPFANSVAKQAATLPGVAAVVDQGLVPVKVGDATVTGAGVSGSGLRQAVELKVEAGDITSLDSGRMAISHSFAADHHLGVGDPVTATVGTSPAQRLTVGAVYTDSQAIGSPVLVPRALYEKSVPAASQVSFAAFVKVAPGADLEKVRSELTDLVKPQLVISVQDKAQFKEASRSQVNQLLGILYALLGLSVVIAALGIVNTLALSVFERTREIGLLRAVGMTRRQLRRTIGNEAVLTALFGAVLGTALGLTLGVLLQRVLADQGLDTLALPWGQVVATFVLAGVVGLLAALWPAWRASKLDVIRAISSE